MQGICVNGPIPLFYELGMEANFPISETVTAGVMSFAFNTIPLVILLVFWVPNIGNVV